MAMWNAVLPRQTLRAPQGNGNNALGILHTSGPTINEVYVTIIHRSTTVDVPTIERPPSDGINFGW